MNNNQQDWKKQISLFLSAQTISLFGSSLVQYAILWYITLTTSSGIMVMLSVAFGFVPQIIISFFAGVWIDRYDRKKLIMLSDAIIAVVTLSLAILFLMGYKNVELIFAVLFIRSAGTGIQTPAVNAFIPQIIPSKQLMKINGINSSLGSLTMFLSPAISGIILSLSSIETTFFIDVITAIIGISITAFVKARNYKRHSDDILSHITELKKGLSYIQINNFIKWLLFFQIAVLILVSPSAFLTPLMVSRTFGPEVWRLAINEMTFSVGAILGGVLISLWGGFKNRIHTVILASLFYGILTIALGLAPSFMLYLLFNTLVGIAMPCYNTPLTVFIQEKVSEDMHGRVFSFMQIATSGALPLGMLIFGPLADIFTVQSILIGSGSAVVILTLAFFHSKKLIAK